MSALPARWDAVEARIAAACARAGRARGEVRLLPVSKGQPAGRLQEALALRDPATMFGENYSEELAEKRAAMPTSRAEWHYIGRLQSRKIPELCRLATCLHTVSRAKELEILAAQASLPDFYIQANISNEEQKNGCDEPGLVALLAAIDAKNLRPHFRGLMGMASPLEDRGEKIVRAQFAQLRAWRDRYAPGAGLNMGMSGDFEIAIEEGATLVRIGSLLFGERTDSR